MRDKKGDEAIVKELLFGEANRFAREAFKAGAQGQELAFQALQVLFAGLALPGGQTHLVGAPRIGQPLRHCPSRRRPHGLQAPERGVRAPAKDEGHAWPVAASSTHQRQRCGFLLRTNDHLSSAHSRNGAAGSGA